VLLDACEIGIAIDEKGGKRLGHEWKCARTGNKDQAKSVRANCPNHFSHGDNLESSQHSLHGHPSTSQLSLQLARGKAGLMVNKSS
jgi:hypothetical protein